MSGPICPDCDSFYLEDVEGKDHWQLCTFCGWTGESLPYKSMGSDMLSGHNDDFSIKRTKREDGKLFILRVFVDRNDDKDDTDFDLMDIFDLSHMSGAHGDPLYFYIETEVEPTSVILEKVKAMPRVVDVNVF